GRCKFDLFVVERPHRLARQYYDADRRPFAQQGDAKHGAKPADPWGFGQPIARFVLNVMHVNGPAFSYGAPSHGPMPRRNRMLAHKLFEFTREAVACNISVTVSLRTIYACAVGLAQSRCRLDQGIEYRLQIERRAADDLKHVSGGGLLLQRFT